MGTTMTRTMASLPHRRWQASKQKQQISAVVKQRMTTPDYQLAMAMPTNVREMGNQTLITLAALGDHAACCEMLVRHIMTVDGVSYEMALEKYEEIDAFHNKAMMMYLLPYQIGIAASLTAAALSAPLCFHLPTVHFFNHHFVTTDVPEPQDLETWLEVGSCCACSFRGTWGLAVGSDILRCKAHVLVHLSFLYTLTSIGNLSATQSTAQQFGHSALHATREASSNRSTLEAISSI
jgi:hypothetical protein